MTKAVIFDVDGTIWDSSREVASSFTSTIRRQIPSFPEITGKRMKSLMGKTMEEIKEALFGENSDEYDGLYASCLEEENAYVSVHPGRFYVGIGEAIREISRKYPVYIVSNCQKGYVEAMLSNAPFASLVRGHLCYGETGRSKDESISALMEKEGIDRAVYVGDTEGDMASSLKAGIAFVHACYGYGKIGDCLYAAISPSSLPEAVERAFAGRYGEARIRLGRVYCLSYFLVPAAVLSLGLLAAVGCFAGFMASDPGVWDWPYWHVDPPAPICLIAAVLLAIFLSVFLLDRDYMASYSALFHEGYETEALIKDNAVPSGKDLLAAALRGPGGKYDASGRNIGSMRVSGTVEIEGKQETVPLHCFLMTKRQLRALETGKKVHCFVYFSKRRKQYVGVVYRDGLR